MGALTIKTNPFEIRGWEAERFSSIDPTDGFGSDTCVYFTQQEQILLIEPDYNMYHSSNWITNRGRNFFDGIYNFGELKDLYVEDLWDQIFTFFIQTLYIFDHCSIRACKNYFTTFLFENNSIETMSLLYILSNIYSFIKVRKVDNSNICNDLEYNFQLNSINNKKKFLNSSLCLLVSCNTRYEGFYLNLSIRERTLKTQFRCFIIGSLINLTFASILLGCNLINVNNFAKGNSLICIDFKDKKNSSVVFGEEIFKRYDSKYLNLILKSKNNWNNFNLLTPSLYENGINSLFLFKSISLTDLNQFSCLYLLNTNLNNSVKFKKFTEAKLVSSFKSLSPINKYIIDQNSGSPDNLILLKNQMRDKKNYVYCFLPTSTFYESQETFVNTEGFLKRTYKLTFSKKTRSGWYVIRNFLKFLNTNNFYLNQKNNKIVFFDSQNFLNFKNYIFFHFYATQVFTKLNFALSINNQPFFINITNKFKTGSKKIFLTKLKYWIDDFFSGVKDDYSQNSLTLSYCSQSMRLNTTNFF